MLTPAERRKRNTEYQAAKRRAARKVETQQERQDRLRREANRKQELRLQLQAKETADERGTRLKLAAEAERKRRAKLPRALESRKDKEARIKRGNLPARLHNTSGECKAFIKIKNQQSNNQSTAIVNVIENGVVLLYEKRENDLYLLLGDQGNVKWQNDFMAKQSHSFMSRIRAVRILRAADDWIRPLAGTNVTILQATNHRLEAFSYGRTQAHFDAHVGAISSFGSK